MNSNMPATPPAFIAVDRAADDLRRGLPVIVRGEKALLIVATERASRAVLALLQSAAAKEPYLLLTANRSDALKIHGRGRSVVPVRLPASLKIEDLQAIADPTRDLANPLKGPFETIPRAERESETAALKLCRIAKLLPAALVCEVSDEDSINALCEIHGLLSVSPAAVLTYEKENAGALEEIARAQVPLEGAENTTLISYRPVSGGPEHMAIVIGEPGGEKSALVRIHSECFTGDLLASLKCDCGKQLKGAIAAMAAEQGGIVLYLAHEGRGVGLAGKLKAYALQDQGFDTVDANLKLGFDVDERDFQPAAEILRRLGHKTVRLLTNNPEKVAALERFGIKVAQRLPHVFPATKHNAGYLATKKARSGHLL